MSYIRSIPADLYREAELLQCIARLRISLETYGLEDFLVHTAADSGFRVNQCPEDGSIWLSNVELKLPGITPKIYLPAGSNETCSLRLSPDGKSPGFRVFRKSGTLSLDMIAFLQKGA